MRITFGEKCMRHKTTGEARTHRRKGVYIYERGNLERIFIHNYLQSVYCLFRETTQLWINGVLIKNIKKKENTEPE